MKSTSVSGSGHNANRRGRQCASQPRSLLCDTGSIGARSLQHALCTSGQTAIGVSNDNSLMLYLGSLIASKSFTRE